MTTKQTNELNEFLKSAVLISNCSQGGIRGGAATLHYPAWHLEFENLIVLKNNKGVDENRIRHLDYSVQLNSLMLNRVINNEYITLFSPDVAEGKLYEYFYSDPKAFEELYIKLEQDQSIRKKRIKATEFVSTILNERASTGRIYIMFIDNVNESTPFVREIDPIRLSNLCQEICLPTKPLDVGNKGEIALCTLAAFVLDNFDHKNQDEVDSVAMSMVRALDNLLSYQDYPVIQAEHTLHRRALGVGVTNYASWLASNYHQYTDAEETKKEVHELFERLQYALIKASVELAKEKGSTIYTEKTKYGSGLLPIDWYNKNVDKIANYEYVCDWESLRADLIKYGIRNSTLSAFMPCETSSQVSNSTNGIEPPRSSVVTKQSKDGVFNQVVPKYDELAGVYDYAWDMAKRGNKGYLTHVAIMQKFVDQSISSNLYYDPQNYENNKLPLSVMLEDILFCNYYGIKTLYYHNTRDGADGNSIEDDCDSCKV